MCDFFCDNECEHRRVLRLTLPHLRDSSASTRSHTGLQVVPQGFSPTETLPIHFRMLVYTPLCMSIALCSLVCAVYSEVVVCVCAFCGLYFCSLRELYQIVSRVFCCLVLSMKSFV